MKIATPSTPFSTENDNDTEDSMGRNWALPNVPIQPMNGMIRTYDNQQRTFSRPYSAKTVFFYKEGDEYFTGVRVPISKSRYRTIDSLLDDLNRNIQMPFGVRRLTTPMGRTPIEDIGQLEHLGKYVASSSRFSRGINLSALERLKKIPSSPSLPQKMRLQRSLGLSNVIPSKQVFFVLNGKGRFYRTLLNPLRLPSMEQLLIEVSEGLEVAIHRVYSSEGVRVTNVQEMLNLSPPKLIACPRNERPTLRESVQLPMINANRFTHRRSKTETTTSSSSTQGSNGIEKPRRMDTSFRRNTRKTTGAMKKRIPQLPPLNGHRKATSSLPDEGDSGKANSISSYDTSKIEEDRPSSDYPEHETMPSTSYDEDLLNGEEKRHKISIHSDHTEDEVIEHSDPSSSRNSHEEQDLIRESDSRPPTKGGSRRSSLRNLTASRRNSRRLEEGLVKEEDEEEGPQVTRKNNRMNTACSQREEILRSEDEEDEERNSERGRENGEMAEGSSHRRSICSQREDILPSRQATARSRKSTSCSQREEILPSEHPSRIGTAVSRISQKSTGRSEKESILPSDDEDYGKIYRKPSICSQEEDILPSQDEEDEEVEEPPMKITKFDDKEENAAIKIQAAFRGYHTRKRLKVGFAPPEDINPNEMKQVEMGEEEMMEPQKISSRPPTGFLLPKPEANYTIGILTGNRWCAETEADVYMYIHGKEGVSRKIVLAHECPDPRFKQNQHDIFHENIDFLGTLTKIVIGHNRKGYGAGIFIDFVTITENTEDGRQFYFSIRKWLDSGQVDGKIERTAFLSAIYYMDSIPMDIESHGRWQFIIHNGTLKGDGGTTSGLLIYGYGTIGSSFVKVENDSTMKNVPDKTLIQVDFGNIGDLIKVRFEVDGAGEEPTFYLDYVELMDMDTEERLLVRVGKWLDRTGQTPKSQPFREIAVYRPDEHIHLPLVTYDGKIFGANMKLLTEDVVKAELHGEWDSGTFPLNYNEAKNEFSFKVECVYIGTVQKIKLIGEFTDEGKAVLEGMSALQDIWDLYSPGVSVADQVIGVSAHVRESSHVPYRYVLGQSRVMELDETAKYFKTLCLSGMEGLSTRNKKEQVPTGDFDWDLEMSVQGTKVPDVWVVQGFSAEQMVLISSEDDILRFEVKKSSLSTIDKVRVSIGRMDSEARFAIYKMRLRNTLTGAEMRFPSIQSEFFPYQVLEFSTAFPDIPPKLNCLYTLKFRTLSVEGKVKPKFTLFGLDSDSGQRTMGEKSISEGSEVFDIEAVNLGDLKDVEVEFEAEGKSSWQFDVTVTQNDIGKDFSTVTTILKKAGKKKRLALQEL